MFGTIKNVQILLTKTSLQQL